MSGLAYNTTMAGAMFTLTVDELPTGCIEYVSDHPYVPLQEEAAGKVGKIIGVIAAIAIPFAAPAIWGAIAGSTAIGASISGALTGVFGAGLTNIIGSAAIGGLMNAGIAYASGARGGDVWRAAGMGALQGGLGGLRAPGGGIGGAAGGVKPPPTGVLNTMGKVSTNAFGQTVNAAGQAIAQTTQAAVSTSPSIMGGITQFFGNAVQGLDLNRISAALINAAVNNKSMGRLDGLVAQQRAELEALRVSDNAAYQQRISTAQQILADADKMDPNWIARVRMADAAGMEANQFRETMRSIAVRQGGSLDAGQRKAYERGASLHAARTKALASQRGFAEGQQAQASQRAAAAQLFGPNDAAFRNLSAQHDIQQAQFRAHADADASTWGGISAGLFGPNYGQATSPDPSTDEQNGQQQQDGFFAGLFNPFGRG